MQRREFVGLIAATSIASPWLKASSLADQTVTPIKNVDAPESFTHRFAQLGSVKLHYIEEGKGPLVLLLHGIPYLWISWRHQIAALASSGYRVVAPDLRGFGQSSAPADVADYEVLKVVGDLVALMQVLGEKSAIIVGHDLGSRVAYAAVELRPDLFRGLVMVNSPGAPRDEFPPSASWAQIRAKTGKRYYHDYFQTPGLPDAQMNADIRQTLHRILVSVSGSAKGEYRWRPLLGKDETILDTFPDSKSLPEWLPPQVFDYYVEQYKRNGFTPALNYYRCLEKNWEQTPFLSGRKLSQPALFIGGVEDPSREIFMPAYDALEANLPNLPNLRKKLLLDGVGHDAMEEKPEVTNRLLLEFLPSL
jgi:pimeloyl-ACP methyl ester carboxylesterase